MHAEEMIVATEKEGVADTKAPPRKKAIATLELEGAAPPRGEPTLSLGGAPAPGEKKYLILSSLF
jgi:hypothetical protein